MSVLATEFMALQVVNPFLSLMIASHTPKPSTISLSDGHSTIAIHEPLIVSAFDHRVSLTATRLPCCPKASIMSVSDDRWVDALSTHPCPPLDGSCAGLSCCPKSSTISVIHWTTIPSQVIDCQRGHWTTGLSQGIGYVLGVRWTTSYWPGQHHIVTRLQSTQAVYHFLSLVNGRLPSLKTWTTSVPDDDEIGVVKSPISSACWVLKCDAVLCHGLSARWSLNGYAAGACKSMVPPPNGHWTTYYLAPSHRPSLETEVGLFSTLSTLFSEADGYRTCTVLSWSSTMIEVRL